MTDSYWQNKISLFLHDPPHKALDIRLHESKAKEFADALFGSVAPKDLYANADQIASYLTRIKLPNYSENEQESGAIDFLKNPVTTHPLAPKKSEHKVDVNANSVHNALLNFVKTNDLGQGEKLFNYLFFKLKKDLAKNNVGGLGNLWELLPADTRIPDHSIWHHCALTSAIGSCLNESRDGDKAGEVSLAVFSITPVQGFIAASRKLRDSWCASIILSYLAFIGIKTICEKLGADHIIYPSLNDQSLIYEWLNKKYKWDLEISNPEIASFPNKFVFICPPNKVKETIEQISENIKNEWKRLSNLVEVSGTEDYWTFSWASAKLNRKTDNYYAETHSLIQKLLAAAKLRPTKIRKSQNGEKCPLCGEYSVAGEFEKSAGKKEKLCAICAIKRCLPIKLQSKKNELLYNTFKNMDFPDTYSLAGAKDESDDGKGKYYAILLMDGDKMGDLINGKTIEAKYADVVHPIIKEKFGSRAQYSFFQNKREVTPAVHTAISDYLNIFARKYVANTVEKPGKLVYAGGDDVFAILPLKNALQITEKIAKSYKNIIGDASGISISATLLLVHHKEPLREVIREAHSVLEQIAKEKSKRNSIAIRLKKRSGGDRDFYCRWDSKEFESFKKVVENFENSEISSSLAYNLAKLESALKVNGITEEQKIRLFEYEIKHSGIKCKDIAKNLVEICCLANNEYNFEAPVIARFLGGNK
jgi:CRISPR-associated protein Cmr2